MRSMAWIWVFSSVQSTAAASGRFRYSLAMGAHAHRHPPRSRPVTRVRRIPKETGLAPIPKIFNPEKGQTTLAMCVGSTYTESLWTQRPNGGRSG